MTAQSRVLVGSPPRRLALTAILLLIAAIAAAGIGAYLVQQQKPAASDDWPGFRGDARHSGLGQGPIGNPVVAWKASLAARSATTSRSLAATRSSPATTAR